MLSDYMKAIWLILPITFISTGLALWQAGRMAKAYKTSMGGLVSGYFIGGLIFGWIAIQVYGWMAGRWPTNAPQLYLEVAPGLALLLSIAAIIMRLVTKSKAWIVWIVMNFLWALGYGWFIPRMIGE